MKGIIDIEHVISVVPYTLAHRVQEDRDKRIQGQSIRHVTVITDAIFEKPKGKKDSPLLASRRRPCHLGSPRGQQFSQHGTMAMCFILAVAADREIALVRQRRQ